jgi:hypothetical protein
MTSALLMLPSAGAQCIVEGFSLEAKQGALRGKGIKELVAKMMSSYFHTI